MPTPRRPGQPGGVPTDPARRAWSRPPLSAGAGAVQPLPIVATVGVNGIDATSASLVGSVNPNGSTTTWWFVYGTSQPPSIATVSASAGSGTIPITVTLPLTGLTTNAPYFVAAVGQNTAGTVYGATLTFVPVPAAAPASQPITPVGQPSVTIPHFNVPPKMVGILGAQVVEQDSSQEVLACVMAIVECPIGACPQLPSFGRPQLTFADAPIPTTELVAAVQRWEPRATESAVVSLLPDGTSWRVTLNTASPSDSLT